MEKRGDTWALVHLDAYVPRAIAGIAALKETLEDRALPIFLNRRARNETVVRLRRREVDSEAQALRDQCYAVVLARFPEIMKAYEADALAVLEPAGLDDRAVDLWQPLIALAIVADTDDGGARAQNLIGLAKELSAAREEADATGTTAKLVKALRKCAPGADEKIVEPTALLVRLQADDFGWITSTKKLATLLLPLGLVSRMTRRPDGRTIRAYHLNGADLDALLARYGDEPQPQRTPMRP